MKELHQSIAHTASEAIIKENQGFRVRVEKHEVLSPAGLFSLDIIQESLLDGKISDSQTYNFFMTKAELEKLASAMTS